MGFPSGTNNPTRKKDVDVNTFYFVSLSLSKTCLHAKKTQLIWSEFYLVHSQMLVIAAGALAQQEIEGLIYHLHSNKDI